MFPGQTAYFTSPYVVAPGQVSFDYNCNAVYDEEPNAASQKFAGCNAGCSGPFLRPCVCPQIYAPVRCSDGTIYINACIAACQGASGCTPVGP